MNSNGAGQKWDNIFEEPNNYQYYDLFSPHQDINKVGALFKKNGVTKILDVGCGLGNNLFYLSKVGYEVSGLDASPNAIKQIEEQMSDDQHLQVKLGNFEQLPFIDQSFDAVISIQVLNHGYEKDIIRAISEIKRVLKPQGLIFVTLPGRISQGKVRYCLVKTAKKIEAHTYLPTIGDEIGVPHQIYTKELLKKHYQDFEFLELWKDAKDYYCLVARLK